MPQTLHRRRFLGSLLAAGPILSQTGCASLAASLPTIARIITTGLSILVGVNNGIQELFRMVPDIPLRHRRLYTAAFDKAVTALRLLGEATEGGKDLSDDEVQAAFDHFIAAYTHWRELMQKFEWMNDAGAVVIENQVIAEAPPASELRL